MNTKQKTNERNFVVCKTNNEEVNLYVFSCSITIVTIELLCSVCDGFSALVFSFPLFYLLVLKQNFAVYILLYIFATNLLLLHFVCMDYVVADCEVTSCFTRFVNFGQLSLLAWYEHKFTQLSRDFDWPTRTQLLFAK